MNPELTPFKVDERIEKTCFTLVDWPLSRVLLKNNADYPWLILVPRKSDITEITQFCEADYSQLMREIYQLSKVMQDFFQPDKLNLGALGNMVSQFHFHIVGRFKHDPLWPQGMWQSVNADKPYQNPEILVAQLKDKLIALYR